MKSISPSEITVIFFGTPDFAIPVFDALLNEGYKIPAVFSGKGAVASRAHELGIKILQPRFLKKDPGILEEFKALKPDLCVVASYGKILPKEFLEIPRYGFINIHPSLLPKYRGPSPIQTAIINGDSETGVAVMAIDEEVDHGPLLASREFSISNFQFSNHDELAKELFIMGAKLLIGILPKYINGEIEPKPQDHSQATFTKTFNREDGRINWQDTAEKIYNTIRALNPEPGTWTTWKNKIINIKKANLENGKIIPVIIQMEGKKELPFEEFLRGYQDFDISQLK